jgi:hypothetical protein
MNTTYTINMYTKCQSVDRQIVLSFFDDMLGIDIDH